MKKIIAAILAILMLTGLLAACGQQGGGWAEIEKRGELIVGLDDTFAPMGFRDDDDNLVGFDIDLANAVGRELGVQIKFQPINWKANISELNAKRVDVLWNGMSATPARQEALSLTNKYLNNEIVIMSYKDGFNIKSAGELKDAKIGTQSSSAALEVLEGSDNYDEFKDNISLYDTYLEASLDMETGRIDCIVVDRVYGDYMNTKLENKMSTSDFDFGDDLYAIGCRKEDTDLVKKLNDALKRLIDSGEAAQISIKWFGENKVIFEGYN